MIAASESAPAITTTNREAPYQGLRPFQTTDASFFFGRASDRRILAANLIASRLTILYGASGVGKSSLLRAGVAVDLQGAARRNLQRFGAPESAVVVFDKWKKKDIIGSLAEDVAAAVAAAWESGPRSEQQLPAEASTSLHALLKWASNAVAGPVLIVLDQFEEYFQDHSHEAGPGTFAAEFPRVVRDPTLDAHFLITIREDALAGLDAFANHIPGFFDRYIRLEHLTGEQAREAIEEPVRLWRETRGPAFVERDLVDVVLSQVQPDLPALRQVGGATLPLAPTFAAAEPRVEAPLLQLVMDRLWAAEEPADPSGARTLRLQTYEALNASREGMPVRRHTR
jgi:hypothetical protein